MWWGTADVEGAPSGSSLDGNCLGVRINSASFYSTKAKECLDLDDILLLTPGLADFSARDLPSSAVCFLCLILGTGDGEQYQDSGTVGDSHLTDTEALSAESDRGGSYGDLKTTL